MNLTVDDTVQFNKRQVWSETDNFALERYDQFIKHLPQKAVHVLDVGCNTGRGGAIIKRKQPHR